MKHTRPLLIGAALLTLAVSAPASAQVYFGVGDHDWGWRHHHHYWRDYANDCRVIRERIVTPSGRVIYRSRQICD